MWLAVCEPHTLGVNRGGDRPSGRGDLHVYDIDPARLGQYRAEERLHPCRVLPLQAEVKELLATPDRRWLFYLARVGSHVHLGRIDAERQAEDGRLSLPAPTRALCLTPDGRTLYAAGGTELFDIDPATLSVRRRVDMKADFSSVVADNHGRVYLGEQGQWTYLTRLELNHPRMAVQRWSAKLHGRIYLRMAPDQSRLYVGTSSVISNHLDVLLLRGHKWSIPPHVSMALSDANGPVRGEFFLTPDGRFLVNRWGKVFRLAQTERTLCP